MGSMRVKSSEVLRLWGRSALSPLQAFAAALSAADTGELSQ